MAILRVNPSAVNQTSPAVVSVIPGLQGAVAAAPTVDVATAMAAAVTQNNAGVYDMSNGTVIQQGNWPSSTNWQIVNANGAASQAIEAFIFNESFFNVTPVANDGAVTKSYNDGFNGKLIDRMLPLANGGRGLLCSEFTITGINAAGNQDPTVLSGCNFTIQAYNAIGGKPLPVALDVTQAIRNNQFQDGILTLRAPFYVNALTQISLTVVKGAKVNVNFTWDNRFQK